MMALKKWLFPGFISMTLGAMVACKEQPPPEPQVIPDPTNIDEAATRNDGASSQLFPQQLPEEVELTPLALAELEPAQGYEAKGIVSFIDPESGIGTRVIAKLSNLSEGMHGFHIHENGDCSVADGSSAGGHFNPTLEPHASREAESRHVGDLGNLVADVNGLASADFYDERLTFEGADSVVGKAVIVHSNEDDFQTQPSGNAGEHVACGVIELHSIQEQGE